MVRIATYDTRTHVRYSTAGDIRKTNAYVRAFAYAAVASKKRDYQD